MAQIVKLKRTSVAGKVPSTSNLQLGELAINTNDGRIFFKKNDGSDSIEHIVTTDSITTGSITITGTTQTTTLTTTNRIDKQYLDDEVLNTSLNAFTQSAITITGNGVSGSVAVFNDTHEVANSSITSLDSSTTITHDNNTNTIFTISGSNGELFSVIDSNSGNLLEINDSSGIDVFTVSATGDVSASGAITASGITGLTSLSVGGTTTTNNLTISSLSTQGSEATALMINGSNVVGTRELGSNAFNSTAFATGDNFDEDGTFASLRAQGTTASDVGLGNVTNESKSTMFTSPTFTGTPLSTTPSANDNSTKIATTAYVQTELTDLVGNAPAAFDTLGEISASLAADSGALDSLTTVVSGKLQKDQNLSDLTNVSTARSNLGVDAAGTDNSTDVTLANTNYLSLSGQQLTGGTVPIGSGGTGATTAGAARTALGVDAAGTDNSTDVTLAGSYDYITISGQTITRNQINLTTDVTGVLPSANLDSDTAHLSGTQTFTGAKTFSKLGVGATHNDFDFYNDGTSYFNGNTTVNANLTVDAGSISISGDGSNATTLTESGTGDFTIAAQGDIILDADGTDIILKDGTIEYGRFKRDNSDFIIKSATQDKDIVFRGNDGGSTITALTLDMSNGGSATFRDDIDLGGKITQTGTGENTLGGDLKINGSHLKVLNHSGTYEGAATDYVYIGGSGLDGADAAIYLGNAGDDTGYGWRFYYEGTGSGNLNKLIIKSENNGSGVDALSFTQDGNATFGATLSAVGDVVAYASSDKRLKDNIIPISNPTEKLKQIGGYTFDWNDNQTTYEGHDVGVIAQEIEKVLPEVVTTRDNGYKAVKYEKLVALLIESNKELIKRVEELEKKLEDSGN